MKTIILKDVPLKSGVVPSGTPCQVEHHAFDKGKVTTFDGRVFLMKYTSMHRYISNFKPFDHESLRDEELLEQGASFSPLGHTVEIDGSDPYGFPSIHRILLAI